MLTALYMGVQSLMQVRFQQTVISTGNIEVLSTITLLH